MNNLAIEYLDIGNLTPYERNARKHGEYDVDAICASIREFGFDDPIGIWGDNNLVVEGHGRLLAAKKLGLEKVPCVRLDHLDEDQRRAYALAHNRTAELSKWDEKLKALEQTDIFGIDMSAFGFDVGMPDAFDGEYREKADTPADEGVVQFMCPKCGYLFLEDDAND